MSSVHIRMHKIWKCGNQTRYLKKKKKLKPSCYISNANNQILNIEHWTTFFVYNFLDSKFPLSLLKKKKKKIPSLCFQRKSRKWRTQHWKTLITMNTKKKSPIPFVAAFVCKFLSPSFNSMPFFFWNEKHPLICFFHQGSIFSLQFLFTNQKGHQRCL